MDGITTPMEYPSVPVGGGSAGPDHRVIVFSTIDQHAFNGRSAGLQ
jgi:hypothetical protein